MSYSALAFSYDAENHFCQRETISFRFMVHRTRLFGMRLADAMALSDEAIRSYAQKLVDSYIESRNDDELIDQVICDLHEIGVEESRCALQKRLRAAEAFAEAEFYQ